MAYASIAFIIPEYDRTLYANWWLKAYEAGTTTPLAIATDSTGATTAAKIELDAQGFPVTSGGVRFIPFIDGDYDLWLFPTAAEADANDTTNAIQFADNQNPVRTGNWVFDGNVLRYTNPTGALIYGSTSDGADTGALAVAAGGSESSTRGAVINLYGEQHVTWPGELFLTPVTDGALGRINLEAISQTRRGVTINARWALTPGALDATTVPDPDGILNVLGNFGTLGADDPHLPGFTAQSNANLGVFEQRSVSNGITIGTENNVAGRIAFGDPDNSGAGQVVYDHATDSMQFSNINGEAMRIRGGGQVLIGKTTSNVAIDGIELRDNLIQVTNTSSLVARYNLKTTVGTIAEYRFNDVKIGAIAAKDGNYIKVEYGSGGPFDTAGPNSPEGVLTAPVGSTYRRTNGGAGTTFYVKETGTGNTGWVAK